MRRSICLFSVHLNVEDGPYPAMRTAHSCRWLKGQDAAVAARIAVVRCKHEFGRSLNSHIADEADS